MYIYIYINRYKMCIYIYNRYKIYIYIYIYIYIISLNIKPYEIILTPIESMHPFTNLSLEKSMAWQETPFHPPETQLSLEEALEVPSG